MHEIDEMLGLAERSEAEADLTCVEFGTVAIGNFHSNFASF